MPPKVVSYVVSTFSWRGQIFLNFSMPPDYWEIGKKQHFICSNLTLFIVPFFLSFFLSSSFFLFFLFFLSFFFFLFPWGGGGRRPPDPLKWRPWSYGLFESPVRSQWPMSGQSYKLFWLSANFNHVGNVTDDGEDGGKGIVVPIAHISTQPTDIWRPVCVQTRGIHHCRPHSYAANNFKLITHERVRHRYCARLQQGVWYSQTFKNCWETEPPRPASKCLQLGDRFPDRTHTLYKIQRCRVSVQSDYGERHPMFRSGTVRIHTASDLRPITARNDMFKFADDSSLVIPASNVHTREHELEHIQQWASENKLSLNKSKSQEIIFRKPVHVVPPTFPSSQVSNVWTLLKSSESHCAATSRCKSTSHPLSVHLPNHYTCSVY